MGNAPEKIVIAGTLEECGNYYANATEAEGEHGGAAVEYIRADIHAARIAELEEMLDEAGKATRAFIADLDRAEAAEARAAKLVTLLLWLRDFASLKKAARQAIDDALSAVKQ